MFTQRLQSVARHTASFARSASTYSKTEKPERFYQTIVLSNGATYTIRSTSPRNLIRLAKDTRNHPLWNPAMLKEGLNDESERLTKFQKRFGAESGLGDLSWIETDEAMSTTMKKAVASGGYKRPAKDDKKKRR